MAACQTPFILPERNWLTGRSTAVPCGRCPNCLSRIISGWSFRLVEEGKEADSSFFVTLTYDNDHVPISRNGFMTLEKAAVQKFFKRLRKTHQGEKPITYFAVGEYGSHGKRPHYHIILFNSTYEDIISAWAIDGKPLGNVFFGYDCSEAAIGYTLKYMMKPHGSVRHTRDDREKEFRLMSKGLGSGYLKKVLSIGTTEIPNVGLSVLSSMAKK